MKILTVSLRQTISYNLYFKVGRKTSKIGNLFRKRTLCGYFCVHSLFCLNFSRVFCNYCVSFAVRCDRWTNQNANETLVFCWDDSRFSPSEMSKQVCSIFCLLLYFYIFLIRCPLPVVLIEHSTVSVREPNDRCVWLKYTLLLFVCVLFSEEKVVVIIGLWKNKTEMVTVTSNPTTITAAKTIEQRVWFHVHNMYVDDNDNNYLSSLQSPVSAITTIKVIGCLFAMLIWQTLI